MGVMVETWVVKDPALSEERDEFFMKWFHHVVSRLGKSSPPHRYYDQSDPAGGRCLMVEFESREKMDEVMNPLRKDETFMKFSQEFLAKYVDEPPKVMFWQDLKREEIDNTLN